MPKILSNLLIPIHLTYNYTEAKEVVVERIAAILNKSGKTLSDPDMSGRFIDKDTFVFSVPSGAFTGGLQYSSTLSGKIIALDSSITSVKIEIHSSIVYKVVCIIITLIGCVYLYKGISSSAAQFWSWGIAMLIGGPLICNWLAGIANETVKDRYLRYIHKA
jgi:hypothetical protein